MGQRWDLKFAVVLCYTLNHCTTESAGRSKTNAQHCPYLDGYPNRLPLLKETKCSQLRRSALAARSTLLLKAVLGI